MTIENPSGDRQDGGDSADQHVDSAVPPIVERIDSRLATIQTSLVRFALRHHPDFQRGLHAHMQRLGLMTGEPAETRKPKSTMGKIIRRLFY